MTLKAGDLQHVEVCRVHGEMLRDIGKRVPIWVLLLVIGIYTAFIGGTFLSLDHKIEIMSETISSIDKKQAIVLHQLKLNGRQDPRH